MYLGWPTRRSQISVPATPGGRNLPDPQHDASCMVQSRVVSRSSGAGCRAGLSGRCPCRERGVPGVTSAQRSPCCCAYPKSSVGSRALAVGGFRSSGRVGQIRDLCLVSSRQLASCYSVFGFPYRGVRKKPNPCFFSKDPLHLGRSWFRVASTTSWPRTYFGPFLWACPFGCPGVHPAASETDLLSASA